MTKKEFGRLIAFILVACMMLVLLCDLFEQGNTTNYHKRFTTFYDLPKNTLDAVWIGTSGVDRYWIPSQGYDEYGMTIYPMSCDEMPTWLFINVIEEFCTRQNPDLIIVDARAFGQDNTKEERLDARARRVLDSMPFFSLNRFKAAFKSMKIMSSTFEGKDTFDISYLLSYVKQHSKWMDDGYSFDRNLGNNPHGYLGFYMSDDLTPTVEEQKAKVYNHDRTTALDPVAEESLYELLDYADKNNFKLLFVETPQFKSKKEVGRANALFKILEAEGIDYINFCDTDENGTFLYCETLDPKTDFYNDGHVNYHGAKKFTTSMAAYLNEHYDFPDHREDPAVQADWDGISKKIKKKVASWEKAQKD